MELPHQEAFQLLEKDDVVMIAVPPVQTPKAGEIYLFKPDKESNSPVQFESKLC